MQGVEQVGGNSPTMPSSSIDPVTDGILVDLDDTAGTPQRITFGEGPHRDSVIRLLCTYPEVRRPLTRRKGAVTPSAQEPRNTAVGPTMDQMSAEAAFTIVRALAVWTVALIGIRGLLKRAAQ